MENTIAAGSSDLAPNRVRLYRASRESTTPVAAPAKATSGRDFDPISSSCRNNSRNSNGGVTEARRTCQKNRPRSPNHSRNSLINVLGEFTAGDVGKLRSPESGGAMTAVALNFLSITDLNLGVALRAHCSCACEKARSGVRCRGTQGRCLHPHTTTGCSCPSGTRPWHRNGLDTMHRPQSWFRHTERRDQKKKRRDGRL